MGGHGTLYSHRLKKRTRSPCPPPNCAHVCKYRGLNNQVR